MVLLYNLSFSIKFKQLEIQELCECAESHLTTGILNTGSYSVWYGRNCQEVVLHTWLTGTHIYEDTNVENYLIVS